MRSILFWAGVVGAGCVGIALFMPAASASCITDQELDAAVGEQVRSGAFTVNTAGLGDRPMCSGLSVAQTIQNLRAAQVGERETRADASRASEIVNAERSAAGDPRLPALERYVGKWHGDRIGGYAFNDHPVVLQGLAGAGVTADLRRSLADYEVTNPLGRQGSLIIDQGCVAHNCSDEHYTILLDMRTGAAAFCRFDATVARTARWWVAGQSSVAGGARCGDKLEAAPAVVRAALADSAGTAGTEVEGALPDVTAALRFENARTCESRALITLTAGMTSEAAVSLGPVRHIRMERSGPDAEGWHSTRAPFSARWNGLTIDAVEYLYFPESDGQTTSLIFREAPAVVGNVLGRLGFPVRRAGDEYETNDDLPTTIALVAENGHGRLNCSH